MWKVIEEISFGTIKNIEDSKPILWGLIIPLLLTMLFKNLFFLIIVPMIAIMVQNQKGEKKKAQDTFMYASVVPITFGIIFFIGALVAAF